MKKSTTKLTLSRETLRNLEQPELAAVEGAATLSLCLTSCNGCNTRNTCTSKYC